MPATYPANKGQWSGEEKGSNKDKDLLKRVRDRYRYFVESWKPTRDEGELDMRCLSTDGPWDPAEKNSRKELKRPCMHLDQLSQYTNSLVNEVKQSPIGIKIDPTGHGASDETAELRQDRIRQIEYENDATDAYLNAFEDAVERGYGAFGILTEDLDWDRFEKKIVVRSFPNPDAVYWDPDCKKADCSDMADAIVITHFSFADFGRKFKKAEPVSFSTEDQVVAPEWVHMDEERIQVAEYWYVEVTDRTLYFLEDSAEARFRIFKDEIEESYGKFEVRDGLISTEDGQVFEILKEKQAEERKVWQCITNGLEVLKKVEWPGRWIPIIPVLGKERYIRDGSKVKRVLESFIRHARPGQLLFDYYTSSEAESVGLVTKPGYTGYEGQFDTQTPWADANKVPLAYKEVKARIADSGDEILPLPRFDSYEPPIQAIEIGKESSRRTIQSILGSYGFSKMDDTNVKSGIALERLEQSANMASYHFVKNLKASIRHAGRIMNELLEVIEDEPQEVAIRKEDGKREVVMIGEGENQYSRGPGARHDVTISDGPSFTSQREAGKTFSEQFMKVFAGHPLMPMAMPFIIKLQNLGPIGDQLADILTPPQMKQAEELGIPPEVMQQMQQLQQALQAAQQMIQEYEKKDAAKVTELTMKAQIEQMSRMMDEKIKAMEVASKEAIAVYEGRNRAAIEAEKLTSSENLAQLNAQAAASARELSQPGPAGQ